LKIKRFCFDIDGTIAELKKNGETYKDVLPKEGSIETLQKLKSEGHYIILSTARNMETFSANVGKITAIQGHMMKSTLVNQVRIIMWMTKQSD
jgi:hydroxymethylpyrimidine pyrophosphatase-like HAD family hydrolase